MSHSLPTSRHLPAHAVCGMLSMVVVVAAAEQKRNYDLPRGEAATMLARFAEQSGRPVLFAMDKVRGARANAVVGEFSPAEALDRLLAGTELIATFDRATGDIVVSRRPPPAPSGGKGSAAPATPPPAPPKNNQPKHTESPPVKNRNLFFFLAGWLAVGTTVNAQTATTPVKEETLILSPFEVVADKSDTYEALNFTSLSGTNRSLDKLPITAEIFNATLLSDLAINDVGQLMANYATGIVGPSSSAGSSNASGSQGGDRYGVSPGIRGLSGGSVRRNGFLSANNLAEAFEIERVEFIRGPQSLLYGTNNAGGLMNVVTKKATFGPSFNRAQTQIDNFGTTRYTWDSNIASSISDKKVALRVLGLKTDANYWRDLVSRNTKGLFGELAVELIQSSHTILRYEQEERIGETVAEPSGQIKVSGMPSLFPNNIALSVLLGRKDPALAQIANGAITWNNIDALYGNANATQRRERYQTFSLSSDLTSWLQLKVLATQQAQVLSRGSPSPQTSLQAPLTGGNPLSAWAIGYGYTESHNGAVDQGLRILLTSDFTIARSIKNTVNVGVERTRNKDRYSSNYAYDLTDANGNFVANPALANGNTSTQGRTTLPIQWVDISKNMIGPFSLGRTSYTINGNTYVRHEPKTANANFAAPGNPLGFNGGAAGMLLADQSGDGAFGALFTTWLDGKLDTLVGLRYDSLHINTYSTGSVANASGATGNAGFVWNITKPVAIYAGLSSNYRPGSTNAAQGIDGLLLPNGRGKGWESGLKLNGWQGKISGSLTYFQTDSLNENTLISSAAIRATDPVGINGNYYATLFSTSVVYDRKTFGAEATITAKPTNSLRLQFGYTRTDGREGSAVHLPRYYNDQFNADSAGQVLLGAGGEPLRVPVDPAIPIASDGKTYASGIATEVLTISTMKNGDARGNYKASIDPNTGQILNATALGLTRPGVATRTPGVPIAQHQLGYAPPTGQELFLERRGGDRSIGFPRHSLTLTSAYSIDRTILKGSVVGLNLRLDFNTILYYYNDTSAGGARKSMMGPDRQMLGIFGSYERKLGKRILWKTQVNINNLQDKRYFTQYPNISSGVIDNAHYILDPRLVVWSNTFSF